MGFRKGYSCGAFRLRSAGGTMYRPPYKGRPASYSGRLSRVSMRARVSTPAKFDPMLHKDRVELMSSGGSVRYTSRRRPIL